MDLSTRPHTKQYFLSILVIASVLVLAFSSVIYQHYADAQRINAQTLHQYETIRHVRRVLQHLVDMETGVRGFQLTGQKRFLSPYEKSKQDLSLQLESLREFAEQDPNFKAYFAQWVAQIEQYTRLLASQVEDMKTQGRQGVSQDVMDQQKLELDTLRQGIDGFIDSRRLIMQQQISAAEKKQRSFRIALVAGTLGVIAVMSLATFVILSLLKRGLKLQEDALQTESRFLTVMTHISDGIYDYNVEDGSIYYSKAYKAMLGYAEDEMPDTLEVFNQHLHPDDAEETWRVFHDYREGTTASYSNEFRLRHKQGHWVWILSRGVGLRDAKGKMVRLIGSHTDITPQKNREEELRQLSLEMETFTYITSHDLRAPLVNLRGFATEMERAIGKAMPILEKNKEHFTPEENATLGYIFREDIPESLHFIVQSVEKMDALTTAVLDLSRIGKREYRSEKVETQTLLQRCLDTLAYEITQKNIRVEHGPLPTIQSDALALEQVFSNILDNAIKYLDPKRPGELSISAREEDNSVVFAFADNGRGIAASDSAKVFQIFRRARNTTDVRGLGMGMAFVQATLRRLGGSIWFESEPGKGTTFYFRLPKFFKSKGPVL